MTRRNADSGGSLFFAANSGMASTDPANGHASDFKIDRSVRGGNVGARGGKREKE